MSHVAGRFFITEPNCSGKSSLLLWISSDPSAVSRDCYTAVGMKASFLETLPSLVSIKLFCAIYPQTPLSSPYHPSSWALFSYGGCPRMSSLHHLPPLTVISPNVLHLYRNPAPTTCYSVLNLCLQLWPVSEFTY